MEKREAYKKSLALLTAFVSESSENDIYNLLEKYKKLNIHGPTYNEYLQNVQSEFENINWYSVAQEVEAVDLSHCNVYQIGDGERYSIPPPIARKNISTNQDSTIIVESFFLV